MAFLTFVATVVFKLLDAVLAARISFPFTLMLETIVLLELLNIIVVMALGARKFVKLPSRIERHEFGATGCDADIAAAALLHQRIGAGNL